MTLSKLDLVESSVRGPRHLSFTERFQIQNQTGKGFFKNRRQTEPLGAVGAQTLIKMNRQRETYNVSLRYQC